MDIDFPALMKEKSDEALQKYLDDYTKYEPAAIEAAIDEIRSRGRVFSGNELDKLARLSQLQRENIEKREKELLDSEKTDLNRVTDETAPVLYPQAAVVGCSIFFGVMTGAILLTINIRRLKNSKGIFPTLIFGSLYTLFQAWVMLRLDLNEPVNKGSGYLRFLLGIAALGAIILKEIFWRRYIGKATKYRSV